MPGDARRADRRAMSTPAGASSSTACAPIAGGAEAGASAASAVEAAYVSHASGRSSPTPTPASSSCRSAGWVEAQRAVKEPAELERIEVACAIADRGPRGHDRRTSDPASAEHDLALALEWRIRTGGAEALAFDVACLSGPSRGAAARLAGPRALSPRARCCSSTSGPRSRAIART